VPVLLCVCVKKASVSFPSSSERHPWSLLPPSWFWFTAQIFASVISLPLSKSALFLLALFLLLSPADWSSFPPDHRRGRELSHGFCLALPGLSFPWSASAGAPQFGARLPVHSPLALITAAVAIPTHVLVSFRIGSLEWPLKGSFFGPYSSPTHQDPVLRVTYSFRLLNFSS
jgi:hypothetical protein